MEGVSSDLELSVTFRSSREQLGAIERALAAELPQPLSARAAG